MKKYLGLALALCISVSSVYAASEFGTAFKNAVKSDINAIKDAAKQDVANQKAQAKKQADANKKAKKDAIEQKRKEQLKPVEVQIKQKEKEIKDINKNSSLTQVQKTIKTRAAQRQLDALNTRKANINKIYDSQLKAIGY